MNVNTNCKIHFVSVGVSAFFVGNTDSKRSFSFCVTCFVDRPTIIESADNPYGFRISMFDVVSSPPLRVMYTAIANAEPKNGLLIYHKESLRYVVPICTFCESFARPWINAPKDPAETTKKIK